MGSGLFEMQTTGGSHYCHLDPGQAAEVAGIVVSFVVREGGKDFDIFSSYEDAVADKNPWKYCNGGDRGVGFPRDCGAARKTNWTWFAFPKGAVYTMDAIPKPIDFISRFDNRYVSGRNYKSASFEIYVDGVEAEESEPES